MGLDSYLTRKTYVKNWSHQSPDRHHTIILTGPYEGTINPGRISYIIEEVAYWRKANAIHAWFVNNVQGGSDDCEPYYVTRSELQALLGAVETVLESTKLIPEVDDPTVAKALLPTQSGFFFGSTEYDERYVKDLEYTREVLTNLLAEDEIGEFEYQSSW